MTTETSCQDWPNSDTRQDAKHWNITKSMKFFFSPSSTTKIPSHRYKVNAEQSTLFLQYNNQGGHATWYPRSLCSHVHHPPMSKLAQVNKATVTLANCKWSTVPQIVYYRLREHCPEQATCLWKNTCNRTSVHHFASGPHWSQMQHPWEREGFSKTDSTQYCNSRDTQNQEGAQLLAAPPMHKIQQNGAAKTI